MGNIFKTGAKINLGIISIPILAMVASFIGLKMWEASCESEFWKQYYSPDKEWKVVLTKTDCSPFNELSYEGDICRVYYVQNCSNKNIFSFYATDQLDNLRNASDLLEIVWNGNSSVSVMYDSRLYFDDRHSVHKGIKITYHKKEE